MSDVPAGSEPLALHPGEPGYLTQLWRGELRRAASAFEKWEKDADEVEKRYALESERASEGARLNILWSNVETLAPALYAKPPKAVAARRFLDKDPIGRVACRIIQRAVQYQVDGGEIHQAMQMVVLDRLLAGRGQVWCRYEPTFEGGEHEQAEARSEDDPGAGEDAGRDVGADDDLDGGLGGEAAQADPGRIVAEVVHVDYVHWRDFRHDPARTWDEVQWVARRAFMTRAELKKRFPDMAARVPLVCGPDGEKSERAGGSDEPFRKAEVWEIWDKARRQAVWIATGCDVELDVRDDPYGLESFFPCPRPLFATVTNGSLVPTPDYRQYKGQAKQLDTIVDREDDLTEAMRVRGAYDASAPEIGRILNAGENKLIAVDRWDAFAAQAGGLKGSIDFLPLDVFGKALEALAKRKADVKADAFEITGLSDILRGQGDPDETATGVQTKGHFATLRLKRRQADVAAFVRDVVRIMAEMTCELFQPETLAEMASCQEMDELQIPAPMPPPGLPGMPPGPSMGGLGPAVAPQPATMAPGGPPMQPQKLPMMAGTAAAAPGIGR